jgi:hypothetical protein
MLLTANGTSVLRARITLLREGVWHARLQSNAEDAPTGAVTLATATGDLELSGTLFRGGTFAGKASALIVGGKAGLSKDVPAKYYRGIPARIVLTDALGEVGETLSSTVAGAIIDTNLVKWTRAQGPAANVLRALSVHLGTVWRVLPDGTVWLGTETWPDAPAFTYQILSESPDSRRAVVGTDSFSLRPATMFEGRRVAEVAYEFEPSKVRAEVTFEA